ncbi:MAG: hypothetical protein HY867_13815 [Chloroflexi bacterium]|nr:hypothetical protein [Chloroflexota bacterium]
MSKHRLLNLVLILAIFVSACGLFPTAIGRATPTVEVNLPPLPAPSPLPSGTIEEAAAKLAELVRQEGDTGLAALETALAAAGFPVQNDQGQMLQLTGYVDAGIVIPDWQVRAIALTAQSNALIRLTDLANILCGMDGWAGKEALVAEALLVGIRDGLGSDVPASTRFFSAFIIELGKQQPESADWLTETDPNNIWIDGLQVQLIMRRLANEIAFSAPANPETPTPAVDLEMPGPLQLAWSLPILSAMGQNAPAHSLCTLSPEENSYIGAAEDSIQKLFEILIKDIAKTGERYFTFASWFNAAITWANLIAVWATIRIDAQMEGDTPLERTKHQRRQTGELRNITVTVNHITSDAQLINCFGLAFASIGLSMVKLPNGGPVEGAGTEWVGLDGFVGRGTDLSKWIVQFNAKGKNPTNIKTDAEGQAEMYVEGFGQETEISKGTPPVDKSFTILVTVRLKDADFWQDLIDAAKTAQEGPGIGGIVKFMVEMLQRTTLVAPSLKKTFPVIDWVNGYTADMSIYTEARITQLSENISPSGFLHVGDEETIYADLHGQKCGGVGGKWILEVVGDPQVKGNITVQIDANTLRGNWEGNITEVYTGIGPQETKTWTLGGAAQFFDGNPTGLELKVEKYILQMTQTYQGFDYVYNGSATGQQIDDNTSFWVELTPITDGSCK